LALPQGVHFHRFWLQVNTFLFFSQETDQLQDSSDNLAGIFWQSALIFFAVFCPASYSALKPKLFLLSGGRKNNVQPQAADSAVSLIYLTQPRKAPFY
jgi:hypothetical protein